MGSRARVIPGRIFGPRPGAPKFGSWGSSWRGRPMPVPTQPRGAAIEADDGALLEDAARGDAVDDLLVDRDADRGRIAPVALERRHGPELTGPLLGVEVEIPRPDAGPDERLELAEDRGHDAAALAHGLELGRGLEDDHRHSPVPVLSARPRTASRTLRTSPRTAPAGPAPALR